MSRFGSLLVVAALACGKKEAGPAAPKPAEDDSPQAVKTAVVEQRSMPRFLAVSGSLRSDTEAEVAADAAGKVLEAYVERGSPVKQGDPLVRLDVRTARLSETQAKAQSKLAESNAEYARQECERADKLFQAGIIPEAEHDRRKTACQTSEQQARAAAAGAELAQKSVNDAVVRAPVTGIVGERFVNVGQYVNPASRVASIFSVDPLRLEISIPESELGTLKRGLPVEFTVAAWPDQVFTGSLRFISPNVRAQSRDLIAEAVVANKDGRLRPGMFAAVKLRVGDSPMAVAPSPAVRKGEVAASVFAVKEGRAEERVVQLGDSRDGVVAIVAGVKPGEKLILNPGEKLHDGSRVTE